MTRWFDLCRGVWFVVSILLMAQPLCAQTQLPGRPYRGLFGGDATTQRRLHELDLTLVVNGAADNGLASPVIATPSASATGLREFEELYSAGAELAYTRRGKRVSVDARGSSTVPYYSLFPGEATSLSYGANANLTYTFGTTALNAFGSYLFSPYYSMTPGAIAGPGPAAPVFDFVSAPNPNQLASAGASWARRFSRRSSLSVSYSADGTLFVDQGQSTRGQGVRVSQDLQISRSLNLRGSYAYRQAEYATSALATTPTPIPTPTPNPTTRWHDIDVGFGYVHLGARGRTTSLTASLGASIVDDGLRQNTGWRGSVHGDQAIGTNWTVGGDYSRALQAYGGLQEPVWVDFVGAMVGGRIGPRVSLSGGANYSAGEHLSLRGQAYSVYSGTARMQVALNASVAVTVNYIYYRYDFPAGFDLPAGMPHLLDRQRVQFGARFWLPLVRGGRASEPRLPIDQ